MANSINFKKPLHSVMTMFVYNEIISTGITFISKKRLSEAYIRESKKLGKQLTESTADAYAGKLAKELGLARKDKGIPGYEGIAGYAIFEPAKIVPIINSKLGTNLRYNFLQKETYTPIKNKKTNSLTIEESIRKEESKLNNVAKDLQQNYEMAEKVESERVGLHEQDKKIRERINLLKELLESE